MAQTLDKDDVLDQQALDHIARLCRSEDSVSSVYAKDPSVSPGDVAAKLYGVHHLQTIVQKAPKARQIATEERLEWARSCGRFGSTNPSKLFLHAWHDILQCLHKDSLSNCCSPSLCGTTGFAPMTIIAPLHDQLRHMSNLIVRAEKEVLLATNFWKASEASTFVSDALRELSKRAVARGDRVVVKIMYDRGDVQQFITNHQNVTPKTWTGTWVGLPDPKDIPNVDLAVVNFHRPPLGTFHAKWMVVDRKYATVSSNNIQDNDNLEMMSHLEGPIVNALWDTFLVSWHNPLDPPLPQANTPATETAPSYEEASFKELFTETGAFRKPEQPTTSSLPEHMANEPHYDPTIATEIERMRSVLSLRDGETHADAVARHLNQPTHLSVKATAPAREPDLHFFPFIPVPPSDPVPMAVCSRKPYANLNNESSYVPQNEAWLSLIAHAERTVFIQTPDLNSKLLLPAIVAACKRGIQITYYVCLGYNDTGEMLPGQGGTNEMAANALYKDLQDDDEARSRLKVCFYTAADQTEPIHNAYKQRSCHIKLLIVDEQVAIQGSGNQDTQSWFHSQEINVMIDSPVACQAWREGIERNQNTAQYGLAKEDGCWYDHNGKLGEGSYGTNPGHFMWAKGALGMFQKARGKS